MVKGTKLKHRTDAEKMAVVRYAAKHSIAKAAEKFGVGSSNVFYWKSGRGFKKKGSKGFEKVGKKIRAIETPNYPGLGSSGTVEIIHNGITIRSPISDINDVINTLNRG